MNKLPFSGYTVTDLIERFNLRVSEARRLYDFILSEISVLELSANDPESKVVQLLNNSTKEQAIRVAIMYRNFAWTYQDKYEQAIRKDLPPDVEIVGYVNNHVDEPSTTGGKIETVNIPLNLIFTSKGTDE